MAWPPPSSSISSPCRTQQPPTDFASVWRRFLADLIDVGILGCALAIPTGLLIAWVNRQTSRTAMDDWIGAVWWIVFVVFLIPLGWCLVLSLFEGQTGRTPGRWVVKTIAVDAESGLPIGFARAFARRFCVQYPGVLFFLVAYPWMLWDENNQTLYDKMFETVVINDPSRRASVITTFDDVA
jgi:uncharacterized RDD family membrane protein YckC